MPRGVGTSQFFSHNKNPVLKSKVLKDAGGIFHHRNKQTLKEVQKYNEVNFIQRFVTTDTDVLSSLFFIFRLTQQEETDTNHQNTNSYNNLTNKDVHIDARSRLIRP